MPARRTRPCPCSICGVAVESTRTSALCAACAVALGARCCACAGAFGPGSPPIETLERQWHRSCLATFCPEEESQVLRPLPPTLPPSPPSLGQEPPPQREVAPPRTATTSKYKARPRARAPDILESVSLPIGLADLAAADAWLAASAGCGAVGARLMQRAQLLSLDDAPSLALVSFSLEGVLLRCMAMGLVRDRQPRSPFQRAVRGALLARELIGFCVTTRQCGSRADAVALGRALVEALLLVPVGFAAGSVALGSVFEDKEGLLFRVDLRRQRSAREAILAVPAPPSAFSRTTPSLATFAGLGLPLPPRPEGPAGTSLASPAPVAAAASSPAASPPVPPSALSPLLLGGGLPFRRSSGVSSSGVGLFGLDSSFDEGVGGGRARPAPGSTTGGGERDRDRNQADEESVRSPVMSPSSSDAALGRSRDREARGKVTGAKGGRNTSGSGSQQPPRRESDGDDDWEARLRAATFAQFSLERGTSNADERLRSGVDSDAAAIEAAVAAASAALESKRSQRRQKANQEGDTDVAAPGEPSELNAAKAKTKSKPHSATKIDIDIETAESKGRRERQAELEPLPLPELTEPTAATAGSPAPGNTIPPAGGPGTLRRALALFGVSFGSGSRAGKSPGADVFVDAAVVADPLADDADGVLGLATFEGGQAWGEKPDDGRRRAKAAVSRMHLPPPHVPTSPMAAQAQALREQRRQLAQLRDELLLRSWQSGFLHKQGHVRRSWKRRYFVLCGSRLMYYRSGPQTEGAAPPASTQAGVIDVREFSLEKQALEQSSLCMRLSSRSSPGLELLFVAENGDSFAAWARALHECMLAWATLDRGVRELQQQREAFALIAAATVKSEFNGPGP